MSDVHKEIRQRLGSCREGSVNVQWWDRVADKWWTINEIYSWNPTISYQLLDKTTGEVLFTSYAQLPDPGIDSALTATDYADTYCKAAVALLIKPNRTEEDIGKAHAWLTLAVGGQR